MYGDLWDQIREILRNHLRKINGLAHKPLGYRYTIPQSLLNDINMLDVIWANARGRIRESRELAPFYLLPPALGKREEIALLQGGPANPGSFVAGAPQSGPGPI